jgi:ketosteroid isomerase-like protein
VTSSSSSCQAKSITWALLGFAAATFLGCAAARETPGAEVTDEGRERDEVRALEEGVALVLANEGFDAYAALFHPDYTNWSGGPKVLDREAFLEAVRRWYDAGNRAVAVEMRPLSIELLGDLALSRYVLREEFNDGTVFVGRFASLARRHEGRWTLYRTSFSTVYRGAREEAPELDR